MPVKSSGAGRCPFSPEGTLILGPEGRLGRGCVTVSAGTAPGAPSVDAMHVMVAICLFGNSKALGGSGLRLGLAGSFMTSCRGQSPSGDGEGKDCDLL